MTMRVRGFLMVITALAMMSLASCDHYNCNSGATFGSSTCASGTGGLGGGGGNNNNVPSAFAFTVGGADTLDSYMLSTGAGTFIVTPNYTSPLIPQNASGSGMVVAQKQYLYAAFPGTGQILGWSISSAGTLTTINSSPFSAPYLTANLVGVLRSMITNPAGTLLFAQDTTGNQIYVYQIGSGGVLNAGSAFPLTFQPQNMATDGLGKYLYVTAAVTSSASVPQIAAYSISSAGALTAVAGSPFSQSPTYSMQQVQGDASGQYLVGTTSSTSGDNHLYVFSIAQSGASAGAITPVSGSPFATAFSPYSIAVQPVTGEFVYSFSLGSSNVENHIEGYQLNTSTGALIAVSGSPFTSIPIAISGQFDQSGAFLFAYDSQTTDLTPLEVGAGGVLTEPIFPVTTVSSDWTVTDPQ
jgi:6-phosphogluconolactonase